MRIAIEGCTHGELDKTYETIQQIEKDTNTKVDVLICCGDFQSTRNLTDLLCMAVPDKYKSMCSFYKYYSGEKTAPVPTLFIGGNHEASNYLQELPYGGWVAPNIFYLGYACVLRLNGSLRVGGLSGIYKGRDYLSGHHELTPYDRSSERSVYHIRNLETFRLKQLAGNPPQIMMSHDWPNKVYQHGDVDYLLRKKNHFQEDVAKEDLGSRPSQELLETLKPPYWFSAHLHIKYPALVDHGDGKTTKFLALDKCLPQRRFLQILEVGEESGPEGFKMEYDPEWLAVLKNTDHLLSVEQSTTYMPGPGGKDRWDFTPTDEEIEEVVKAFGGDLTVPENFYKNVPAFDPSREKLSDMRKLPPPSPQRNQQTVDFCKKLGVRDPCDVKLNGKWPEQTQDNSESVAQVTKNANEIELDDESSDEEAKISPEPQSSVVQPKRMSLSLPAPVNDTKEPEPEGNLDFVIDSKPTPENMEEKEEEEEKPKKKVLKRRNQAMYTQSEDD